MRDKIEISFNLVRSGFQIEIKVELVVSEIGVWQAFFGGCVRKMLDECCGHFFDDFEEMLMKNF